MADFNISNSEIEQLNDAGNNIKIANNSAPVIVSGNDAVQTAGENNMVEVAFKEKSTLVQKVWETIKGVWKWIFGMP